MTTMTTTMTSDCANERLERKDRPLPVPEHRWRPEHEPHSQVSRSLHRLRGYCLNVNGPLFNRPIWSRWQISNWNHHQTGEGVEYKRTRVEKNETARNMSVDVKWMGAAGVRHIH